MALGDAVIGAPLQEAEVQPRHHEDDGEEDPALGRGAAEPQELPRLLVDVVDRHIGGMLSGMGAETTSIADTLLSPEGLILGFHYDHVGMSQIRSCLGMHIQIFPMHALLQEFLFGL